MSFLGAVPAGALPQDGDGNCAIPDDDGIFSADADCNIGANSPDFDCAMPSGEGGGVHKDNSCTTPQGQGFSRDNDCGRQESEGTLHSDIDCGSPAGADPSVEQRDEMCGKPTGGGPQGAHHRDHACAQPVNDFQSNQDMACAKPGHDGKTYEDGTCGKPGIFGKWKDLDRGKPTGNTTHTDLICNQPNADGTRW
ncbi:hypothetical protein [Engelhardtia mirabilis]|uniref:Uncharacterized protein n=1 Tax=Engelhardtia mirabilis TaxID=2528011 RepID=A0A518BRG2_9BACT|nr:hypothetical protein Pla133_46870 [Planctomycetes bacterium Pla133]QDV03893.1 hypothetical protein Pla86_46850 [Planctomycetes bacterium Pla86]